ncbi:MAG TPA: 2OG-Fe(II) oxygenase [Gammaproteobacteria bacterium]|nr:2OG-Fe(II) oxygenase [Gammaproteobacteria bacterium]
MATQEPLPSTPPPSSDVARAEQCDAAGAHADAVGHLAAGARKHDVEAMTRLGKRLLVGDRSPCLPKDGAGLIAEASARGGAEAAAVLAVLYAVGASRGHGVQAGLQSLIVAAERGWPPARAQLNVLAAGPSEDSAGDGLSPRTDWPALAQAIDLGPWQTPPAATDLSASPLVRSYPQFASAAMCRWFIENARGRLSRALVYEAISREVMAKPTRTNTAAVFNIVATDFLFVLAQLRMSACLGVPLRQFEALTVLHYDEGEEITEHYDFVDPKLPSYAQEIAEQGDRVVTFLVYLNDDYQGGETAFPRLDISHKGSRGEGIFFVNSDHGRADTRTLHAGRTPVGGEKWIVSQFIRDRAVL